MSLKELSHNKENLDLKVLTGEADISYAGSLYFNN